MGEERFTPTCRICGRQHWPLDPSCIGKKGVKAQAKARAKAEKLARVEAKARAKAERKQKGEEDRREVTSEESQVSGKLEAELKAEREARVRAEERAAEYARQREEVRQWAILVEQEKLKAEEKLRTTGEKLNAAEARAEAKLRAEAEAMARVDVKEPKGDIVEPGEAAKGKKASIANAIAGLLALRAGDIMEREVTWCGPEESVGTALAKMQKAGSEYVVIGSGGKAEGIVGRSELKGRLSIGVRRAMSKWKKGGSDTTLGMAVKFVMIRGVQVVSEGTAVAALMKRMRQSGCRVLAAADESGKVVGLVTACNVMKIRSMLRLEGNPNLLKDKEMSRDNVPSAAKTEIKILGVFKPSGLLRRAGRKSEWEVSSR